MHKLVVLIRRAVEVLKEEGPVVLASRIRLFLSLKMQYYIRRRKRKAIKEYKSEFERRDDRYNHNPRVSFALQSFNRSENIRHLATRIPQGEDYETIVLEDGSIDGSLELWDRYLTRRNDFLIRSNDLHEIRTYTRAAQFSRGEYLCLLQDDDTLPQRDVWIEWVLEFFESFPDLAVVGGWGPVGLGDLRYFDSPFNQLSFDGSIPPISDWTYSSNDEKFPLVNNEPLPVIDPHTRRPFVFVPIVSVGPYIVDIEAFEMIGGFDLEFSEPGMPGVMFDADFALRCWKNGYRVGYVNMGNYADVLGGTVLYSKADRERRSKRNVDLIKMKHESAFEQIEKSVCEANSGLVLADNPSAIQGLNLTYT